MKQRSLTVRYAILQFSFWVCFAAIVAFSSYYLLGRGLNNIGIGWVIAMGGLMAAVMQPVVGIIMDRFPQMTSPKLFMLFSVIPVFVSVCLLLIPDPGLLVIGLLYGMAVLTVQLCQGILNVIGVDSMSGENKLNFNVSRAFGSLGYAVAAWGIGQLTEMFPPYVLLLVILGSGLVVLVTAATYPLGKIRKDSDDKEPGEASGPLVFLKKYPRFALMLPALILIYFSHQVLNTFTLQIMTSLKGGSREMGMTTAIAAGLELFMVLGFGFFRRRFRMNNLLRVSAFFFLLKAILSATVTSVVAYYAVQICQMFAWGIICVALVYYVNETIPVEDRAKGQTYAGMTHTVAGVLCGVIGGSVIENSGIQSLMLIGCIGCFCGMLLLFVATGENRKNRVKA